MKKGPHPITLLMLVGILSSSLGGCEDDGMLIAEEQAPGLSASESNVIESTATLEEKAVQGILQNSCSSCRGPTAMLPHGLPAQSRLSGQRLEDIDDFDALVDAGQIVPGVPEESPLMLLLESGSMPPASSGLPPVSARELRQIARVILRMNPPTEREVARILLNNCGSCHGDSDEPATLPANDIDSIDVLVAAGLIVPGDRDRSMLYRLMERGTMPPRNSGLPPVTKRELARIGGFIDLLD